MNCKKIQKFINDYIDGELSKDLVEKVKHHLNSCPNCREFEKTLRRIAIEPFKKIQKPDVPEEIWSNIKSTIKSQQEKLSLSTLLEKLNTIFLINKRPVFAIGTAMTVLLIASFLLIRIFIIQNIVNSFLEEQIQFLHMLNAESESFLDMIDINLGTTIEKYLL